MGLGWPSSRSPAAILFSCVALDSKPGTPIELYSARILEDGSAPIHMYLTQHINLAHIYYHSANTSLPPSYSSMEHLSLFKL
jgi:hypothetical protein